MSFLNWILIDAVCLVPLTLVNAYYCVDYTRKIRFDFVELMKKEN